MCWHCCCLPRLGLAGQMGSLRCHFLLANMRVQPGSRPRLPVNTTLNFPGYSGAGSAGRTRLDWASLQAPTRYLIITPVKIRRLIGGWHWPRSGRTTSSYKQFPITFEGERGQSIKYKTVREMWCYHVIINIPPSTLLAQAYKYTPEEERTQRWRIWSILYLKYFVQ